MPYRCEIPYGAYWSTPFARWQGAFANLHSLEFAAYTVKRELGRRNIPGEAIEHGVLGFTVPQKASFYGMPWLAGMAGLCPFRGAARLPALPRSGAPRPPPRHGDAAPPRSAPLG